ncbi:hypothetical protein [Oryzifoliimicrobium ureilyticus]|uniref:hypothetical protein n=1 Tax=Oryzifoliimicrobium ureilyticus TaxID=3113724 RepID=UPI003076492E
MNLRYDKVPAIDCDTNYRPGFPRALTPPEGPGFWRLPVGAAVTSLFQDHGALHGQEMIVRR